MEFKDGQPVIVDLTADPEGDAFRGTIQGTAQAGPGGDWYDVKTARGVHTYPEKVIGPATAHEEAESEPLSDEHTLAFALATIAENTEELETLRLSLSALYTTAAGTEVLRQPDRRTDCRTESEAEKIARSIWSN